MGSAGLALAVQLSQKGYFTWKDWAGALAAELKAAADCGEPDDGSHYYHHWLTALERLVAEKRLASRYLLAARKDAWVEAYRHTRTVNRSNSIRRICCP
jgi:nitrile hydratase accessory protein